MGMKRRITLPVLVFSFITVVLLLQSLRPGADTFTALPPKGEPPVKPLAPAKEFSVPQSQVALKPNDHEDVPVVHLDVFSGNYKRFLFTCFYRTNHSFYVGSRKPPSLQLIVVMLASFHRFASQPPHNSVAVVFVDARTGSSLRTVMKRFGYGHLLTSGAVRLWVVRESLDKGDPGPSGVATDFRSDGTFASMWWHTAWASKIKNGANNWRFAMIRDFLSELRHRAGSRAFRDTKVVIADATDVAFQQDPFDSEAGCFPSSHDEPRAVARATGISSEDGSAKENGLVEDDSESKTHAAAYTIFTLESSKKTFNNEKYNRKWMTCFGDEAPLPPPKPGVSSSFLKGQPISCAGVTMGNAAGVLAYTTRQIEEIRRPNLIACAIESIGAALDQATHNFILHSAVKFGSGVACASRKQKTSPKGEVKLEPDRGGCDASLDVDEIAASGASTSEWKPAGFQVIKANHDATSCTFHGNFGKLIMRDSVAWKSAAGEIESFVVAPQANNEPYAVVHQYSSGRHPVVEQQLKKRYLSDVKERTSDS